MICPTCNRDMSPRPGAVLTCGNAECPFFRLGFRDPNREVQLDHDEDRDDLFR